MWIRKPPAAAENAVNTVARPPHRDCVMPDPSSELLELVRAATLDSIEFTEISACRVPAQDDDQPPRLDLSTEVQDLTC